MVLTGSPVSQPLFNTVSWQLSGASRGEDEVTLKAGIDDLNDNVLVGDTNDETVFRGIARQTLDLF